MIEKPWAIFITWPKFPKPVQSGEYSNRNFAEAAKQWLAKKLTGYLKIEVVWIDEDNPPPSHYTNASEKRWNRSTLSAIEARRISK